MSIIKIDIEDGVDPELALNLVTAVIQGGRISDTRNGPSYCAITTFMIGHVVFADKTKTMDTFRVRKKERN